MEEHKTKTLTALVLEDEPEVARLTQRYLQKESYIVEAAEDFGQAMQALDGENNYSGLESYAALVLDMNVPGGKGIDIAIDARERGYKGAIIMYSGGVDFSVAQERAQNLKDIYSVRKEDGPQELINVLKQAMEAQKKYEGQRLPAVTEMETDGEIPSGVLDQGCQPHPVGDSYGVFDAEEIARAAREAPRRQEVRVGDKVITFLYSLKFW